MKRLVALTLLAALFGLSSLQSQEITFFFSAGDFSGEPDRFGNTHMVGPEDAIEPRPFGNEELAETFFDEDNLWLIYVHEGNTFLVSHAPADFEDSPEIYMDITVAIGGKYEVILDFLDQRGSPGSGPIQAALGDADLEEYSELNAIPATGGTSPGYPTIDGPTGNMWWQTVSLGETEVEAGGVIRVRVDDVGDVFSEDFVTSTWQGVTLRVIELGGAISEIQISPGAFEWATDVSGNRFRTVPLDQEAFASQEDWLTVNANSSSDNLWNIREGLGSYGPILETFPASGEDGPTLQTSVIFAEGGTYDVFFSLGDIGQVNEEENLANPTPLNFAIEGQDFTRWHANDGEFKGTPGYNDYEMSVGQISVDAGEQVNFLVDDVQDGTAVRSVYLGMRLTRQPEVQITEFSVSPGVFEETTDLFGNVFKVGPVDESAFASQEDWLTKNANNTTDNKWNIREGLGSYGPILESFPNGGEDAPPLRTSVTFVKGGRYDVFFSLGDVGAVDAAENLQTQTPLNFAIEGQELTRWHANDGTFNGTPGYNDYEMAVGQITVSAGETLGFVVDDVQDGTAVRSVFLGMRFVFVGDAEAAAPESANISGFTRGGTAEVPEVSLTWESQPGAVYQLEESTDLENWKVVEAAIPSGGETTSYTVSVDRAIGSKFFRLAQE